MIFSFGPAFPFHPAPEDTAQSPSHIAINGLQDMRPTVLEVPKPAFQCEIQIRADGFHTSSIVASGFAPYRVFEFIQALLARPFLSPFKMVAKEVEPSSLTGINDPCFCRVQFQSVFFYPVVDLFQRLLRFLLASTQNDEVSRAGEFHPDALPELDVNLSAHPAPVIKSLP